MMALHVPTRHATTRAGAALATLLALALTLLLTQAAQAAGQLTNLQLLPNPAMVGAPVTLRVSTTGEKCGVNITFGYHNEDRAFLGQNEWQTQYDSPGSYPIKVSGKATWDGPACQGPDITRNLVVNPRPKAGAAPSRTLKPRAQPVQKGLAPPSAAGGGLKAMPTGKPQGQTPGSSPGQDAARPKMPPGPQIPPNIYSLEFQPGPLGYVGGLIMAPGGTVTLNGSWFGTAKGKVHLLVDGSKFPEYPGGRIELQNVQWHSVNKVTGVIPSPMTGPIHRAGARVVLTRADGRESEPASAHFEVPVEKRFLKHSDAGLRNIRCDSDWCSPNESRGASNASLSAAALRVGAFEAGDFGRDDYSIDLSDGWVFSGVVKYDKSIQGDDDDYIKDLDPDIKARTDHWTGGLNWYVSGSDANHYEIKIEVMRAKGAY